MSPSNLSWFKTSLSLRLLLASEIYFLSNWTLTRKHSGYLSDSLKTSSTYFSVLLLYILFDARVNKAASVVLPHIPCLTSREKQTASSFSRRKHWNVFDFSQLSLTCSGSWMLLPFLLFVQRNKQLWPKVHLSPLLSTYGLSQKVTSYRWAFTINWKYPYFGNGGKCVVWKIFLERFRKIRKLLDPELHM